MINFIKTFIIKSPRTSHSNDFHEILKPFSEVELELEMKSLKRLLVLLIENFFYFKFHFRFYLEVKKFHFDFSKSKPTKPNEPTFVSAYSCVKSKI